MRNGDAGGGKPPSPPDDGSATSSDLFASSDLPDFGIPAGPQKRATPQSLHDEPTRRADAPVAGAFTEGATTVMNDEQRRQALAAAGLSVDPPAAAPAAPVTIHDEPTREAGSFSFGFDVDAPPGQPLSNSFETPASSMSFEAPAPAAMTFEASGPRVPADSYNDPAGGPEAPMPSSLQLPSIDFSLPTGMDTFGGSSGSSPASELPAHLQLPNFPEFDLPAVPGTEQSKRRLVDDVGIEGSLGGSFGDLGPAPHNNPLSSGSADGWAVGPAAGATVPPPPPKRSNTAKRPGNTMGMGDMPGLPSMNLPSVGQPTAKKEPTLLRSDVAEKLATVKKKSMTVPIIAIIVLIVGTGSALFVYKDVVLTRVFGKHQSEAVETNTDKARKLVALGTSHYDANQLPSALEAFEQALAVDPSYAKAHRSLAIAYAKMNQPDKAVTHYRTYLVLAPTAEDAEAVRKIVADYDVKAKEQAAADKLKAEEAAKAEKAEKAAAKKRR